MSKLRDRLHGVVGFPITPFKKDSLEVDYAALERNVAYMARFGFCSMVAAGGTGELYSLTVEEAVEVVRVTKKVCGDRIPVIGGVGLNTPIATAMARGMEQAGADGLLVLPPAYLNAPQQGLFDYYAAVGRASGLPLAIYSRDWAVFTPEMVAKLAEQVPTLDIWKDGQGNGRVYQRIMAHVGDRLAWVGGLGDDCLPTYLACRVQAFTSSISNTCPELAVRLAELGGLIKNPAGEPDLKAITDLMNALVHPLYALREKVKGYEVSVMKYMMDLLGGELYGGPVRPPLENTRPEHQAEVTRLTELYRNWKP